LGFEIIPENKQFRPKKALKNRLKYNFMKITLLFLSLIIVSYAIYSQIVKEEDIVSKNEIDRNKLINTKFPNLKVETLSKNKIELPNNNITIACIVFEQNSQSKVDTWTVPIVEKYPNDNIIYLEIPMIKAGYKFASGFIDNGMRGGVPKDLHDNVATYYGKLNKYKTDLLMFDKNSCYLFLIDKNGIIKYTTESMASPEKLKALYSEVEKLQL
jgi:ATP10 protein